jgi:ATP-dependent DNA helicase RecQ
MAKGRLSQAQRRELQSAVSWRTVAATARRQFGFTYFRPGQRELIQTVLAGRNALGILPTGAGKSLCFQLPSLFLKRTVLVVSPLIALMQDQMAHAEAARLEAARLDSTVSAAEQTSLEEEIRAGEHDIVFVTPERLQDPDHLAPLLGRVDLLVIDEAHCISQWGHDFRPAYLHLRHVIEALGRPPVLALTATATPDLVVDIRETLGLGSLEVIQTDIERENLFFEVARTVNRAEKEQRLLDLIGSTSGSGIVYMATVKRVEELHAWLTSQELGAEKYHGRMSRQARAQAQDRFMSGATRIMVATNAFGLGIDKADVRFVAHWHFPGSVESYYQEAGRAGRDGKRARCLLLYRLEDKRIRSFFLGGNRPHERDVHKLLQAFTSSDERSGRTRQELAALTGLSANRVAVLATALRELEVLEPRGRKLRLARELQQAELDALVRTFDAQYTAERTRLEDMMRYGENAGCRMQFLRRYFGEPAGESCQHCDNCLTPVVAALPEA